MRKYIVMMLAAVPFMVSGQDVQELYRTPVAQVKEFRVGVLLEEKKKPSATILAVNGKMYAEQEGEWNGVPHGIEAGNLRYVMDKKGNLYLTGWTNGKLGVWESSDLGQSWERTGELIPKKDIAYYTLHADRKSGDLHLLYATREGEGEACRASLWLLTSGNAGRKWSDPLLLNQNLADCSRIMASMTSFKDGKRWAIWTDANKFMVDRSYDGELWLRNDISVLTDYEGGMEFGIPKMIMDNSGSQMQGMIYVSGVAPGDSSTVAWVRKSGNVGDSWTSNVPIDPDYKGNQYYPTLTIDQEVGALYAVWLGASDGKLEAWFGHSLDAGQTFKKQKLAEWGAPEISPEAYSVPIDVAAYNGRIMITWLEVHGQEVVQQVATFNQADLFTLPGQKK